MGRRFVRQRKLWGGNAETGFIKKKFGLGWLRLMDDELTSGEPCEKQKHEIKPTNDSSKLLCLILLKRL